MAALLIGGANMAVAKLRALPFREFVRSIGLDKYLA